MGSAAQHRDHPGDDDKTGTGVNGSASLGDSPSGSPKNVKNKTQ